MLWMLLTLKRLKFTPATPRRIRIRGFADIHLEYSLAAGLVVLVCKILLVSCFNSLLSPITVTIFDELFGSEGVKQVYGIVTEWLAGLDESERKRIKSVIYFILHLMI